MDRGRRDESTSLQCSLLRTYARVVELGSMTRAAETLYLAQSAVSSHVAALAAYAGGPLLERRAGKLVPTRLGRVLYDEGRDLLARVAVLEKRLREALADDARHVAVSCTRTVCETSVARIVSLFSQAHPGVRLDVSTGTVKDAEVRLRAGETDVALVEGQPSMSGARLAPFHVDRLLLAVPPGHELAGRTSASFEEAARHPFVLRSSASGTRLLIEQRLGRRFEELAIALELEGNAEVVACVESGIGIAFLSETALASALALRTVVALELDGVDLTRTFYVAVPEARLLPEPAACFADWLTTRYASARRQLLGV